MEMSQAAGLVLIKDKLSPLKASTYGVGTMIKDADLLITGEGKIDFQTSMGKAPIGVAKLAKNIWCECNSLCRNC